MTYISNRNPAIETALGNVAGRVNVQIGSRNPSIGTVFEDVWDAGGTMVYPTAGETWEIVSASTNDTSAGTGARTVLVSYLDDNYAEQTETLTLNGTTPVTFTATDAFRFRSAVVLTWGTVDGTNLGNVTIRVSGVGATRGMILFDDSVVGDETGLNLSMSSHFTVPAGKTLVSMAVGFNVPKNNDAELRTQVQLFGSTSFISVGELTGYQNSFYSSFESAPTTVPEKADIRFIARSSNTGVVINAQFFTLLVDN